MLDTYTIADHVEFLQECEWEEEAIEFDNRQMQQDLDYEHQLDIEEVERERLIAIGLERMEKLVAQRWPLKRSNRCDSI
jgi:hypothetical protein